MNRIHSEKLATRACAANISKLEIVTKGHTDDDDDDDDVVVVVVVSFVNAVVVKVV